MITGEQYIILDEPINNHLGNPKLCIINFNIIENYNFLRELISQNADTTFWAATSDYSKEYVLCASKLGIKNLVQFPIKNSVINEFFDNNTNTDKSISNELYQSLCDSKVLIVDDNELNITLLTEILSDLGIKITSCTNPVAAAELVEKEKFDLFLLDILMPELSGYELAELVNNSSLNRNSKIIFISAISGEKNMINGYKLGAFSYIEKPFSPHIVKAQIYNILRAEEQIKIDEKEKDSFIATLTHDLKSPINAEILVLNHILNRNKNSPQTDTNTEMLSELLNSAKYMKLITDKILSHYRGKSGNLIIKKEACSLNCLILSSIENLKYAATEKNIKIRFYNNALSDSIFADKTELKRVINNLLSNAIEYSNPNSYIDIAAENTSNGCQICVKDYGKGIDLKNYNNIFDEYVTLAKEHKKTGFGLGLSIVKNIINAHNGDISIESKPNKGTSIKFRIPNQ